MTCPFCGVPLLQLLHQGQWTLLWLGCPCCGCMWRGRVVEHRQVNPLAWIPACLHPVEGAA